MVAHGASDMKAAFRIAQPLSVLAEGPGGEDEDDATFDARVAELAGAAGGALPRALVAALRAASQEPTLRTRSAWVYNVNLERHVCEYERRLERCCEQRSSMRGVLLETFEVPEIRRHVELLRQAAAT
jgi:hypothetical protein